MGRRGWKLAHIAALVGVVAVGFALPAESAPMVCRQLQAQLSSSSGGTKSGSAQIRKYDNAINRQRQELAKTKARASASSCGFLIFGRNVGECASLNANIDKMVSNLDSLETTRAQLESGLGQSRSRILAALEANGCSSFELPEDSSGRPSNDDDLLKKGLSNQRLNAEISGESEAVESPRSIRILQPGRVTVSGTPGEFRTMCVRTCDGYFFPMSNAASAGEFERDQKNCESSCPGTRMQLFYTHGIGDDSAMMTSTSTGKPYGELPTAYLYKRSAAIRPAGCGCNTAQGFEIIAGDGMNTAGAGIQPQVDFFTPVPATRPDPAADSETLANAEGAFDAGTVRWLLKSPSPARVSATPETDRKIRVVGPAFLPDPGAAIDLRAPAQKKVQ